MSSARNRVAQLLDAARAGDDSALGRLLDHYRPFLLAIARRHLDADLRAKGGASDLVQDTLLLAFRHIGQFRGRSEEQLREWLRQMLKNECADFRRRHRAAKRRAVEVPLSAAPGGAPERVADAAPSPGSAFARREDRDRLEATIGRLPAAWREVLVLRYRDGLSFAEIGERTGRSENAAEKLWTKAVRQLKAELRDTP